ncbi:hypothetical protein Slala02_66380 [Streptomyces lavendulae subsp. lavendulae]|nr:hypothetical protein Slala01_38630 [Streptomyces lavendulae subsp. lavendulae]GLX30818.1 hypothetical protein Slala02_66380 [Streptomyces lavendulae subsp. lavendulae]
MLLGGVRLRSLGVEGLLELFPEGVRFRGVDSHSAPLAFARTHYEPRRIGRPTPDGPVTANTRERKGPGVIVS